MINRQLEAAEGVDFAPLFGSFDENMKLIEKAFNLSVHQRDNALRLSGEEENVEKASQVIGVLLEASARGDRIDTQKVMYAITMVQDEGGIDMKLMGDDCVAINVKGSPIRTKTLGQKKYVDAIKNNTIVF